MSATVNALAAVVATPSPSPEVIKQTFTTVVPAQVPAVVVQAAQLAGMFVAALVLSFAHRVVEWLTAKEKGWGPKVNTLVATGYSVGVGLVGTATMGQLGTDVSALVALALNTFPALTGTFWTYALRTKLMAGLVGPTASAATVPPLAVETEPVQG